MDLVAPLAARRWRTNEVSGDCSTVRRYRKLPVEVEAIQLSDNFEAVGEFVGGAGVLIRLPNTSTGLLIHTLEGDHVALPGDFIIKGVKGGFYPCKPDIFELTYVPVDEGIVQVYNPRTKRYVKIDRDKGLILCEKKNAGPYKDIPIASPKEPRA